MGRLPSGHFVPSLQAGTRTLAHSVSARLLQPRHRHGDVSCFLLWSRRHPPLCLVLGGGDVHGVAQPVTSREWLLQGAQCASLRTGSPRPTRCVAPASRSWLATGGRLQSGCWEEVFVDVIVCFGDNILVVTSSSQSHEGPSRLLAASSHGGRGEGASGGPLV